MHTVRAISKMVEGLHKLVEPLPVYKDPTQKMVEGKLIFFIHCIILSSNHNPKFKNYFFDQEHFFFFYVDVFHRVNEVFL